MNPVTREESAPSGTTEIESAELFRELKTAFIEAQSRAAEYEVRAKVAESRVEQLEQELAEKRS